MNALNNRYVRLGLLVLGLALLLWAALWLALMAVGADDFSASLQAVVAFLGAGVIVGKFFAGRVL